MVYVDDLKMSGPLAKVKEAWARLTKPGRLKLDPPEPQGKSLGCAHSTFERNVNGNKVRGVRYDMGDVMRQCVDHYHNVCGDQKVALERVEAPFLEPRYGSGMAPLYVGDQAESFKFPDNEE